MKILNAIPNPIDWTYDEGSQGRFKIHDFLFRIHAGFEYTDIFEEADIIPVLPPTEIANLRKSDIRLNDNQTLFVMHFYAVDDHMDLKYYKNLLAEFDHIAKNKILAHKNSFYKETNNNIFYYDSMFDSCKLYFTEFSTDLNDKVWALGTNSDTYSLSDIKKTPNKKFINASYIYSPYHHPRMKYRKLLKDELMFYKNYGFIGSEEGRLLPNNPTQLMLEKIEENHIMWYPIGNQYYQESYISVVVETIIGTNGHRSFDTKCVTEKTFEPLIKGNFVLPFGYSGLIQDILDYGFVLPEWIDYSYDDIIDTEKRFEKYLDTVGNVLMLPLKALHNLYIKDKSLLEHNRQVFFDRPYDELHTKVMKALS